MLQNGGGKTQTAAAAAEAVGLLVHFVVVNVVVNEPL
jgi:hypothetical protein